MKAGLHRTWFARLAYRFLRHERGAISPIFALMLIPICGLMAMAVEVGNGVLVQRAEQHAADSAALAAATGNNLNCYDSSSGSKSGVVSSSTGLCTTVGYTAGYQLEAKAVAAKFTATSGSTVAPVQSYCPGTVAGSLDCMKVTISRTMPFYFGSVIGMTNMNPTAVAYARTSENYDLCFATNNDFTTDGSSTGFSTCYVESFNGTIKCTSVAYAGLFTSNTQACNGTTVRAPGTKATCPTVQQGVNPCLSGSIPDAGTVPCQTAANAPNPANWTWTPVPTGSGSSTSTTNYVRLCNGTVAMSVNANIPATSNNQAIILDNATIDGGGSHSFKAVGTTVISTCSACASLPLPFNNLVNTGSGATAVVAASVSGPTQGTGTFANFALYDDETKTTTTASNYGFDIDIVGEIYEPNRDITLNGSQYSNIGGISCVTMISKSFKSNGGKLANNPVSNCAGNYLTAQQSVANVALVQ